MTHIVLASGSPRRRELLSQLGLKFDVRPSDIDETAKEGEPAADYVLRLAEEKARCGAQPGECILAADTIVVLDGELLGKPGSRKEACKTLLRIQGRSHLVLTGVALFDVDRQLVRSAVEETEVVMAPMSPAEAEWYSQTGEPDDKAGSYGIQGLGALFVSEIRGNYTNVVGLPLPRLLKLFSEVGLEDVLFRV